MSGSSRQVRVLTLNENENKEAVLYRLEKGWMLHFVLGPSLTGKNVRLFTNHPKESKTGPNRQVFQEVEWENYSQHVSDVYDNYAPLHLVIAGSFNYFLTVDGSDEKINANSKGCFNVDPILYRGKYDEKLALDSIACQTVLTKSLGPFNEWEMRLKVAKESGYNTIHFTPIQSLGASHSSYCLMDQLDLNPDVSIEQYTFDDVEKLVNLMKIDWEVLSLTDLVYNHTANESPWIIEHPECAYNIIDCAYLKPAFLMDRILWLFSYEVGEGVWLSEGIPPNVSSESHLNNIHRVLHSIVIPKYSLHEFYTLDIDQMIEKFYMAQNSGVEISSDHMNQSLRIIQDPKFRRLRSTIDIPLAIHLFIHKRRDRSVEQAANELRNHLTYLNSQCIQDVRHHIAAAVNNVIANARWRFVDPHGDRLEKVIGGDYPLMWNYFTLPDEQIPISEVNTRMHTEWGKKCMAHNGWVMNDDPMRNFAEQGSNIYLRRELLPWGDSVKLRYGEKPADNPFLWEHMRKYTVMTAKIFHGVRLDNCHSTPLHVAEYMLDEARKVRPDLYIIAELFTGSEHADNVFINRLGLTSLIRESLNASDPKNLGAIIHRFGGQPVGAFLQPPARELVPTIAHAILMDQTHDNASITEKRSTFDSLPTAALVAMASCASGSNRGFDELVPHHINVVTESRQYSSWSDSKSNQAGMVSISSGIIAAKKALNSLHEQLGSSKFDQIYVDQVDKDIVSVTRHNPVNHQSVVLIARSAFNNPSNMNTGVIPYLCIPGLVDEIVLEARIICKDSKDIFTKDPKIINGLTNFQVHLTEHINLKDSDLVEIRESLDKHVQEVDFINFPPGSVIAFKVSLNFDIKTSILAIRKCISQFGYRMHTYSGRNLSEIKNNDLEEILQNLSLNDINRILYRCASEESDDGMGSGGYNIPGYGEFPYCGLQGVMSILSEIRGKNDLGHALCDNLRDGDWLPEYTSSRLKHYPSTLEVSKWLEDIFSHLKNIPRYLIPCYFDAIITGVYLLTEEVAWAKMNTFIINGSSFVRALAKSSIQFCSYIRTSVLPPLSLKLKNPPATIPNQNGKNNEQFLVSLAAGLPHFSSGMFRNWGRDTFISLKGLLLLTGRYDEARYIILSYAGSLRHGLIPNLLGGGKSARYNCRDAVWWWLQCIKDYCLIVPNGVSLLEDFVHRIFPDDNCEYMDPGSSDQRLHDTIQEAVQMHATGVNYRERDAGKMIDNDMSDGGFNVNYGVDWTTGFVFGGNIHNCGTWMDKNGSSEKAGNKGIPATPRDGSAVELIGLCKSVITWLHDMHDKQHYPHEGVNINSNGEVCQMKFKDWSDMLQRNFESHYWIDNDIISHCEKRPDLINKKNIYKDTFGSGKPWCDYQLRPNFAIAMTVAPELFTPDKAWLALEVMEKNLLGPLGMKTLDPSDWIYNGDYFNGDDSNNPNKAKGYNYHQGPEWIWPIGFFLRAKLIFAKLLDNDHEQILKETVNKVKSTLSKHNVHIHKSVWKSLPELTNKDGKVCHDSCDAQAWSVASIIEVLYHMEFN